MFRFRSLKTKLVTMGIGLTLVPIFITLTVLVVRLDSTNRTTSRECRALADETLDQIVQGVYLVCETQGQVLQDNVNKGLVVTKSVMNDKGDMLRVCTNVMKTDGKRAVGTFIPATNPNGQPNPVVQTVLKGQTFKGKAFVVDRWYLTAYEPIKDPTNARWWASASSACPWKAPRPRRRTASLSPSNTLSRRTASRRNL